MEKSSNQGNRQHTARRLILSALIGSLIFFLAKDMLIIFLLYTKPATNQDVMSLYVTRVVFVISLLFFGRMRRKQGFYVTFLSDMPDAAYWIAAFVLAFLLKGIWSIELLDRPGFLVLITGAIGTTFIWLFAMYYQSHLWNVEPSESRAERIEQLRKKARISKQELASLAPRLTDEYDRVIPKHQSLKSKVWFFLLAIMVGALFDDMAAALLDVAAFLGFSPPNYLLPR